MKSIWVEPDIRDSIVDYTRVWSDKTEIILSSFIQWIGIRRSKYYNWKKRYGKVNEHNSWIPRDCWIEEWEKQAIIDFYPCQNGDGYRRITYMMLDAGVVAVSPSSVYRVLKDAGLLRKWNPKPSLKGTGFKGPIKAHEHWHIDVSYINIRGTFYYFCGVLDGYSRFIVHWEIRESMKEADIEIILQRALEKYPDEKTRIISDNGSQFVARDFREFIKVSGMTHVRTSPYYPQSNGKIERWHQSLKRECIRPKTPLNIDDAKKLVEEFVEYYNTERLHSAIGYITPKDKLEGREIIIFSERDRKLVEARNKRKAQRTEARKLLINSTCQGRAAPEGLGLESQ